MKYSNGKKTIDASEKAFNLIYSKQGYKAVKEDNSKTKKDENKK